MATHPSAPPTKNKKTAPRKNFVLPRFGMRAMKKGLSIIGDKPDFLE
jgi:hypothetical protein